MHTIQIVRPLRFAFISGGLWNCLSAHASAVQQTREKEPCISGVMLRLAWGLEDMTLSLNLLLRLHGPSFTIGALIISLGFGPIIL